MTTIYCLRFETPLTWRARSSYLYPRGTGWPSYTSSHWVPFSSPPTTRRATVEVFDPANFSRRTSVTTRRIAYTCMTPPPTGPLLWRVDFTTNPPLLCAYPLRREVIIEPLPRSSRCFSHISLFLFYSVLWKAYDCLRYILGCVEGCNTV
jgi:hypothetical protein